MKRDNKEIEINGKYITADEFRQRMGWKCVQSVYAAIAEDRVRGVITVNRQYLIPANAVAIDRRRMRPSKPKPKGIRDYLFVMDGVELWAELGYLYLYDQHTLIKEKDTREMRAQLLETAKYLCE